MISERLTLEVHLHKALELGQLLVHYQPRVAIATGRIVGVEALVRWQHPERGLLAPVDFGPDRHHGQNTVRLMRAGKAKDSSMQQVTGYQDFPSHF